jgi:hypothetical protein
MPLCRSLPVLPCLHSASLQRLRMLALVDEGTYPRYSLGALHRGGDAMRNFTYLAVAVILAGISQWPELGRTQDLEHALQKAPTAQTWKPRRTPEGHPDLQGIWDFRSATPLQRPARFAGREFMTQAEVVEYERLAAEREDGRPPDDPRTEPSVHPVWWLDYGKKVVKTRRTSLIIDPPDGRIPPLSAEGQRRLAARNATAKERGPSDSYEDRTLFERCITRGVPEGMLPGPYNNNLSIVQSPGYILLVTEMIHEVRIVPLDGAAHRTNVRSWTGQSRGRWDGDTLVVDTISFTDKTSFHGSGQGLHLVERFTRLDEATLEYRFTVDDPSTWSRPWTVALPMTKTEGPMYEYACHEGNYGLQNILSAARALEEQQASK